MQVTIGIQNYAREVKVETETTQAELTEAVTAALADGTALVLTDSKGNTTFVPGASIAYVELGTEEKRAVGFGQH